MRRTRLGQLALLGLGAIVSLFFIAASVRAGAPSGAGPNDPLMVPTAGQAIAPGATLWFYFDYVTEKLRGRGRGALGTRVTAEIAVDAAGAPGLSMAIYAEAQALDWIRDRTTAPAGRGTPYRDTSNGLVTRDLYWAGGFNTSGRYYIAITNSNPAQVTFLLTVTGDNVTLYPPIIPTPTPRLPVPVTVTPVPTGNLSGKLLFETATGGEIYSVSGDGSQLKRLTRGLDPAWSPDGNQITFARWDNANPGVFVADADGSNERIIHTTPRARWPKWSPDGKYIVFSQDKTLDENKRVWKLGLIELATGKLSEPQCSQLCFVPSWGLDSATVYYADPDRAIMATNVFKGPAWLVGPTATYFDTSANISRPMVNWPAIQDASLSPDGKQIAFSMKAHDRWEINLISINGGPPNGVTRPDELYYLLGQVIHNVAPVWSPDGRQILYLSDRNGKWEFFVTDPAGAEMRQVLKGVTDQIAIQFGYENERIMDWTR